MKRFTLFLLPTLFFSACGSDVPPPSPVVLQQAVRASLPENLILAGTLEPNRRTEIAARIQGRILTIAVEEGERVRADQMLVRLDAQTESVISAGIAASLAQARYNLQSIAAMYDERIAAAGKNIENLRATQDATVAIAQTQYETGFDDFERNASAFLTESAIALEDTRTFFEQLLGQSIQYDSSGFHQILERHLGVLSRSVKDEAFSAFILFRDSVETYRTFFDAQILDRDPAGAVLDEGLALAVTALQSGKNSLEKTHAMLGKSVTSNAFTEEDLRQQLSFVLSRGESVESLLSRAQALQDRGVLPDQLKILERAQEQVYMKAKGDIERAELERDVLTKEKDAKLSEAQSLVTRLEAEAGISSVELGNTVLRAPYDGVITGKQAENGQVVAPGMSLLTLADDRMLKLVVSVPDSTIASLAVGREAAITVDGIAGREFRATLGRIASAADPLTKNIDVELIVENGDGLLKSGAFARATFALSESEGIIMPASAVIARYGQDFVFVVRDGIAERRTVSIENRTQSAFSVTGGILEGEMVIVKGHRYLRDGDPVIDVSADVASVSSDL